MAKSKIDGNSTVYSASAWWQFSDPSMSVVALTAKRAEREIMKMMKDAARSARDDGSYETISAAGDDIKWSGVHAFALKDLASSRELSDAISDLSDDGVWYPD